MAKPISQGGIDYPDGGFSSGGGVYPMAGDLGELAARLGSVVTYNREGNVILLDTFESGIAQWGTASYGTGARVQTSALRCKSPPYSMELRTGQDGAHAAKATLEVAYHHAGRMGLEYAFTHTTDSLYHYFEFNHYGGSTKRTYTVVFDIQGGEIKVRDSDGSWQVVATGLNLKSDAFIFNVGKLVIDTENNEYVRFLFNDTEYSLTDYEPLSAAESSVPYLEVAVQFTGDVAANREHYVDNVIVTQNEPLH